MTPSLSSEVFYNWKTIPIIKFHLSYLVWNFPYAVPNVPWFNDKMSRVEKKFGHWFFSELTQTSEKNEQLVFSLSTNDQWQHNQGNSSNSVSVSLRDEEIPISWWCKDCKDLMDMKWSIPLQVSMFNVSTLNLLSLLSSWGCRIFEAWFSPSTLRHCTHNLLISLFPACFRSMSLPEQPDPDFIKMFVGQIPRSMDEAELTKMFSEYGRVYNINVLRDKVTGQSKGKDRGGHPDPTLH